ncbi:hypothetical protein ACP4OV_030463 [Aristida adscensionis]
MPTTGEHQLDRLSALPDSLLHTIMSFLTAQEAVQTCVLSQRWRNLWSSMPCLDIDQPEFKVRGSIWDNQRHGRATESAKFEEFVNSLLMFHSAQSLDKFRFHVSCIHDFNVVERWLRRGIKYCPQVLEISRSGPIRFYGLPNLGSGACRLKRLHLVAISLKGSFTQELSSGCPVLGDLTLERCHLSAPEITSCTLKNLVVIDCITYSGNLLAISAPALTTFHLVITAVGSAWYGLLVHEMPSLVKASICLKSVRGSASNSVKGPYKLLGSLTNVRKLELTGSNTLLILREGSDAFPTFCNLRTLLFDGCDLSDNFQMLGRFLNNSPSLEKLILQYCKLPEGSRKRKRTGNPKRWTEIKYKEDDVHLLFGLLSGVWKSLQKTSIMLTKG